MKKSRKQKGITLIALVVTIVVLLILAGITIGTLTSDNGVINEANLAKEQAERVALEEQIEEAILIVEQKKRNPTLADVITEIEKIDTVDRVDRVTGDIYYNKLEDPIKGKLDDYLDKTLLGGKPPIPEGFYEVGGTINTGFVISDVKDDDLENTKQGNQFVWVPVPNINDFHFIEGYYKALLTNRKNDIQEPFSNGYKEEYEDYMNMYNSVTRNYGFYIGRYEVGKDENEKVVVKKNMPIYNCVPWGNAMNDIEGTSNTDQKIGAVKLARNFTNDKNYKGKVTSTLVYGIQWDATVQFLDNNYIKESPEKCDKNSYLINGTGKGWYIDNYETGNPDHKTGIDVDEVKSNCVKNIYDMAGNMWEWTMETYNTDIRVCRGGNFYDEGSINQVSSRFVGGNPSASYEEIGFRIALYL